MNRLCRSSAALAHYDVERALLMMALKDDDGRGKKESG
jgi:hypothetical protein